MVAFGWLPDDNQSKTIDALNHVTYMAGEHKYIFDQETDMAECDFQSIYSIGFKPQNLSLLAAAA